MKKFMVNLSDDIYKGLKLQAFEEMRTMKAVLEDAIRQYLKEKTINKSIHEAHEI
jgi:predicted transcriptional regulator